jgi:hypothetical protein
MKQIQEEVLKQPGKPAMPTAGVMKQPGDPAPPMLSPLKIKLKKRVKRDDIDKANTKDVLVDIADGEGIPRLYAMTLTMDKLRSEIRNKRSARQDDEMIAESQKEDGADY